MRRFSQFNRRTFIAIALPILVAGVAIAGPGNYNQQGPKLVGIGGDTSQCQAQGASVALSADGNTALIGSVCGSTATVLNQGAYVFTRTNSAWSQQARLEFTSTLNGALGDSVALSGDGNTAVLSSQNIGAIVFKRSGGVWSFEGQLNAPFYISVLKVAISADGNTVAVASLAPPNVSIFVRSAGVWSALGTVNTDIAYGPISSTASISADGTTIAWGINTYEEDDICDECPPTSSTEAQLYVITRTGNALTPVLVNDVRIFEDVPVFGSGPSGGPVSLTADGNTLLCNGSFLYRKNGVWTFSTDTVKATVLSADGNTAMGPGRFSPHLALASVRVGGVWSVHQTITYSNDATPSEPTSFALSANGDTAIIGDLRDNNLTGAAWVYASPQLSTALTHSGSFLRGQVGATYNAIIKNVGDREIHAGSASAVNAIDTLPAGLTATKMAGPGWSCTLATLTCTRSDGLAVGASFPAITITVNVATNAPSSVTNLVTATGGGCNWAGSRDVTRILP